MDVEQELEALLDLAKSTEHYITVVEKEVLDSLALVLDRSDGTNVKRALQILQEVARHEDARARVSLFPDLCKPIQRIAQTRNGSDEQVLANNLYNTLWPALKTLEGIKALASNPELCTTFVVDDSMLSSLVALLGNNDSKILQLTLETLYQMAEWKKHRPKMRHFRGLQEKIEHLRTRSNCEAVKALLENLHGRLWKEENSDMQVNANKTPSKTDICNTRRDENVKNTSNVFRDVKPRQKATRQPSKLKGKTIVLQIKGLDHKDDVELCRNRILSVKGLISITFDLKKKRSIIRARPDLRPEVLAEAIALTKTMSAEQVIKEETGKETLISFGANHEGLNKENEDMPDYPTEDSPTVHGYKNMASMGSATPKNTGWGFVKSVGDFISSSFYW